MSIRSVFVSMLVCLALPASASAADLVSVPGNPFGTGESSVYLNSVAFSNDGDLAAVANYMSGTLTVYRVNRATGQLSRIASGLHSGLASQGVAWSPSGKFVIVSSSPSTSDDGGPRIAVFRVDKDAGTVTEVDGSPFEFPAEIGIVAHDAIAFHPSGKYIASVDSFGGMVHFFKFDSTTGVVTQVAGSPQRAHPTDGDSGPMHLAFSPDGKLLATANPGSNGCCGTTVSMFKVDAAAGTFTRTTQGPVDTQLRPDSVSFDPAGTHLLIAVNASAAPINLGALELFDVDPDTGELSHRRNADPGPDQPFVSAKFSPVGGLVGVSSICPGCDNNAALAIYHFNAAGPSLTPVVGSPFRVGATPGGDALAFSPAGGLVANANGRNGTLSVFKSPPTATSTVPAEGATYEHGKTALASYTCADGVMGPGIASCSGPVATGKAIDTAAVGSHTFAIKATSADGLEATKTVTYTVADPPTVTLTRPTDGEQVGIDQVVAASYSCADGDGGPGIASCVGTVASGSPIDTSTLGSHSFTVTATSGDGLTTTKTVTYTVVRLATRLTAKPLLPPMAASATLTTPDGTPVAGEQVSFTAGGSPLCVATTDASGTATCPVSGVGLIAAVYAGGYRADYAGSGRYQPSSADGRLR